MPIGVVNAAIVEAALADRTRFAIGIGLGGALADAIHATLAFAGIGHLDPACSRTLTLIAAAAILVYVIIAWRAKPTTHRSLAHGFPTGLLLTLPNPAALGAWLTVAAMLPPQPAIVVGAGVGIGSAAWFTVLARFVAKHRDHRVACALPKVALLILIAIAITTAVRAGCS
jgi:threonine/homoserine/homoserine lactone efflux protein